jgi:hypothetical protein
MRALVALRVAVLVPYDRCARNAPVAHAATDHPLVLQRLDAMRDAHVNAVLASADAIEW